MCLVLPMCFLTSCSSVLCVVIVLGMFVIVLYECDKPSPCLCSLSVCMVL